MVKILSKHFEVAAFAFYWCKKKKNYGPRKSSSCNGMTFIRFFVFQLHNFFGWALIKTEKKVENSALTKHFTFITLTVKSTWNCVIFLLSLSFYIYIFLLATFRRMASAFIIKCESFNEFWRQCVHEIGMLVVGSCESRLIYKLFTRVLYPFSLLLLKIPDKITTTAIIPIGQFQAVSGVSLRPKWRPVVSIALSGSFSI